MSRAKFDFTGYDPEAMRKKRDPSPEVKVTVKEEEDMEVFTGECVGRDNDGDLDKLNSIASQKAQDQVELNMMGGP